MPSLCFAGPLFDCLIELNDSWKIKLPNLAKWVNITILVDSGSACERKHICNFCSNWGIPQRIYKNNQTKYETLKNMSVGSKVNPKLDCFVSLLGAKKASLGWTRKKLMKAESKTIWKPQDYEYTKLSTCIIQSAFTSSNGCADIPLRKHFSWLTHVPTGSVIVSVLA